ncbi:MAG TPA: uroporphyrinogen-III synthase [Symbiobacteriaceae bacterium]|nr:uroporphyrinogen-III synthase [Symbiobacteriaceae bacterium]
MDGALGRKRVLITRAPGQSGRLRDALLAVGAEPVSAPAIQILDPDDWTELDRALAALDTFDWLLFTSQSAVDRVCDRLGAQAGLLPTHLRIAAVGEATAALLRARGLPVHLTPADARGDGLAAALLPHLAPGARLLLPRGDLADQRLPDALRAVGCAVETVIAYRTAPASAPDQNLIDECSQGMDWVILTAGSTVTGLLALLGGHIPPGVKIAVLGPETAKAVENAGLQVDLVAPIATVDALVKAMDNR